MKNTIFSSTILWKQISQSKTIKRIITSVSFSIIFRLPVWPVPARIITMSITWPSNKLNKWSHWNIRKRWMRNGIVNRCVAMQLNVIIKYVKLTARVAVKSVPIWLIARSSAGPITIANAKHCEKRIITIITNHHQSQRARVWKMNPRSHDHKQNN